VQACLDGLAQSTFHESFYGILEAMSSELAGPFTTELPVGCSVLLVGIEQFFIGTHFCHRSLASASTVHTQRSPS
jgi:hypothetical protein